jgi:hypothetical protein
MEPTLFESLVAQADVATIAASLTVIAAAIVGLKFGEKGINVVKRWISKV